jgi:hypothetical protein
MGCDSSPYDYGNNRGFSAIFGWWISYGCCVQAEFAVWFANWSTSVDHSASNDRFGCNPQVLGEYQEDAGEFVFL